MENFNNINSIEKINGNDEQSPMEQLLSTIKSKQEELNQQNITDEYITQLKQNVIDIYKDFIELKSDNNKKIKKKLIDVVNNITKYVGDVKSLLQEYDNNDGNNNSVQNMICQYIFDDMNSTKSNDYLITKYNQLHHYYIGNILLLTLKSNKLENNDTNINELSWFTNHILNNVENNNNCQYKNSKSDSNYKNFVNNLENNIKLLKPIRNNLENNIIVTNDMYESLINESFLNNIKKIQHEYVNIKDKISNINMGQYIQVLTKDYNEFFNKLNQYVTNINTLNQELYKD